MYYDVHQIKQKISPPSAYDESTPKSTATNLEDERREVAVVSSKI